MSLSWVWLMPLAAVIVSAVVVWQAYADRGPVILVEFPSASGIEAGQTVLRYRDVQVGVVEKVGFSNGLQTVEVAIRVDQDIAPYVDGDARFWLIEPEVSLRGVTGLETVLTGVYIEGVWDNEIGLPSTTFVAQPHSPLARPGEEGTTIVLTAANGGQLAAGAPVLFRGLEVGRLGDPRLDPTGTLVSIEAFIAAPHDDRLTTASRFWDTSGVSVSFGSEGLSVNLDSVASLIEGGVAFDTFVTGGGLLEGGERFDLFANQTEARQNALEPGLAGEPLRLAVHLPAQDLPVAVGATVRYQGVRVGEVTDIIGVMDSFGPGAGVEMELSFTASPQRLGLVASAPPEVLVEAIAGRVATGLRARIVTTGLLTRSQELELVFLPDSDPDRLTFTEAGVPLIPPAPSLTSEDSASFEGLMDRVAQLPIEEVMLSAIEVLDGVAALVQNPDMQAVPRNTNGLITDARTVLSEADLDQTLADVRLASATLSALIVEVAESDGLAALLSAMENTDPLIANLDTFAASLPELATLSTAFAEQLADLPLETIGTDLSEAAGRVNTLLADPAVEALAPSAQASLAALETLLADIAAIADSEGVAALVTALEQSQPIADNLDAFTAALPELATLTTRIAEQVADLPLETIGSDLAEAAARVNAILADPAVEALAPSAQTSLASLEALLADMAAIVASEGVAALVTALEQSQPITDNLDSFVAALPELATLTTSFASQLAALPVEALGADLAEAAARMNALLADPALADVIPSAAASLDTLETMLEDVASRGLTDDIDDTVALFALVAEDLRASTVQLPTILNQVEQVTADVSRAELDKLSVAITSLAQNLDAVAAAPGADALPASLNATLEEMSQVLAALNAANAVDSFTQTLASAESALAAVETASGSLPEVVARLDRVLVEIGATAAAYDTGSEVYATLLRAMRDISQTSDAFRSLARTIERNPNSLLTGR